MVELVFDVVTLCRGGQLLRQAALAVVQGAEREGGAFAAGLGLSPAAATVPLVAADPSPALSQMGGAWPTDGRVIGIIADAESDLDGVRTARRAVLDAGMLPLVVAPVGRTLTATATATAIRSPSSGPTPPRSTEFDAVLVAGVPQAGADAYGARDAKAGTVRPPQAVDPRVLLLLTEVYRHGKAIGG
ncbi:hypothetical protein ACFVGY_01895 [Streptomyces sp. NPDC127106]|uniref:hypothetical protein n=1 Tax=Streptomyces sp. NPDC127106 TaxID=3345360 RepID=UPI00364423F3